MFNGKKLKLNTKIAGATMVIIFSLAAAFSGTIAWFSKERAATVTAGSFQVVGADGVQFDLYYLDHFEPNQETTENGNYNTNTGIYSGYEVTYSNPVFAEVLFDENGNVIDQSGDIVEPEDNPTNISHLWPAHRTTYAIVVTGGSLASFSLDTWSETTLPSVLTQVNSQDVEVSLSWAINMFGGAYYVTSTNDVLDDISTGFASYASDVNVTDKFTYSQSNIAPQVKPSINIVNSITGVSGETKRVVLYFSIEFSNDSSTFYSYQNPYYVLDPLGNSNCYKNLSMSGMVFKLA